MGFLPSKEIKTILIGLIIAGISLMITIPSLKLYDFKTVYLIIIATFIIVLGVIWVNSTKTNEIREELEKQIVEQTKLGEKLKIYEQLIDMKADIKELQRGTLKKYDKR